MGRCSQSCGPSLVSPPTAPDGPAVDEAIGPGIRRRRTSCQDRRVRLPLPQVEPDQTLPRAVTVYEVGPRDGLQNEATVVPASVKVEFVRRVAAAGLTTIETTSFVDPRWVPQLADAAEVLALLGDDGRGAVARSSCRTNAAWSERSRPGSAPSPSSAVRRRPSPGATSTAASRSRSRCSARWWSARGRRPVGAGVRLHVLRRPLGGTGPRVTGRRRLPPADGPGLRPALVGTPSVSERPATSTGSWPRSTTRGSVDRIAVHFHDTYGQALSNTVAALRDGVTVVDASTGGLGGALRGRRPETSPRRTSCGPRGRRGRHGCRPGRPRRDERVDGRPPRPLLALEGGPGPEHR